MQKIPSMTVRMSYQDNTLSSPVRNRNELNVIPDHETRVIIHRLQGEISSGGWWPAHFRVVVAGRIYLQAESLYVPMNAGTLWVSDAGSRHAARVATGSEATVISLIPARALIERALPPEHSQVVGAPPWFDSISPPDVHTARFARAVLQHHAGVLAPEQQDDDRQIERLIQDIALDQEDIRIRATHCPGRTALHRLDVMTRLQRVRALLDADFRGNLSLNEMSRIANTSRVHLLRQFQHVYGSTPFQYLDRRRITLASELLADGRLTCIEVARAYGFINRSAFSRWFRLRTGLSPEMFRSVMQNDRPNGVREPVPIEIDRTLGVWNDQRAMPWNVDASTQFGGDTEDFEDPTVSFRSPPTEPFKLGPA